MVCFNCGKEDPQTNTLKLRTVYDMQKPESVHVQFARGHFGPVFFLGFRVTWGLTLIIRTVVVDQLDETNNHANTKIRGLKSYLTVF